MHHVKRLRWLLAAAVLITGVLVLLASPVLADVSLLQRLLQPTVEMTVVAEPARIQPGWNPHFTCTFTNGRTVPLINLVIVAPAPDGLCLPDNGDRATVLGEYDAAQDAMVWQIGTLLPGETVVAHVVWHSYSTVAHGQQIEALFEYRADGCGGAATSDPVVVDRAMGQDPKAPDAYPTLTLTPSPTPSPTPAALVLLEPERLTLERNQRCVISCTVGSVDGLYGADIELAYDPEAITIIDLELDRAGTQVAAGDAPMPDFVARNEVDEDEGRIHYVVTQLSPREPFAGDGIILKMQVAHMAGEPSATTLSWVRHELATQDGVLIPHRVGPDVEIETLDSFYQGENPPVPTISVPNPTPTTEPIVGDTQVCILPASDTVEVGQEIEVSVVISDVVDLYGADIRVGYDPLMLEAVDVDPSISGAQVTQGVAPAPDLVAINEVDQGEARYAVVQMNPRPSFAGSGVCYTMRFRALSAGECAFAYTNSQLSDRWGQAVAHDRHTAGITIELQGRTGASLDHSP